MEKVLHLVLVICISGSLASCSTFSTPTTVVDSPNGTTVDKGESPAKQVSNGYLIPILVAVVLGGYFMKCAETGKCSN